MTCRLLMLLLFTNVLVCFSYFNGFVEGSIQAPNIDAGNVDKKKIFTRPLDQGIYQFQADGFVPKAPLKRLRGVHSEMIKTLRAVTDSAKLLRYLISIGNTVQEDVQIMRRKLADVDTTVEGAKSFKKTLKADAFVFLAGHASLISHLVMYFPDIMHSIFKKNPDFSDNAKWTIGYITDNKLVNEEKIAEILKLAQQELNMIPREADFQNPYRLENLLKQEESTLTAKVTTTKKPRKKLPRGPRLTAGEL